MREAGLLSGRAIIVALCAMMGACAEGPPESVPVEPDAHAASVDAFAAARIAELSAPDSWLSLIGLHWLDAGETTVGSAPDNGIVLPEKADERVGTLLTEGTSVRWRTAPGSIVTQGIDSTLTLSAGSGAIDPGPFEDEPVDEAELTADVGYGRYVVLRHGDLNWIVIQRGDRVALRVRDNDNASYETFSGIDRYPTSLGWRLTARWVPHEKTVSVPNVLGTVSEASSPAAVVFWVDGQRMSLDVVGEPEHGRYMLVFADETSGRTTYGGGRYLWADGPDERDRVVLDFNFAYNPPCAWTAFATCPLPTRDNRLPIAVEAGEKIEAH